MSDARLWPGLCANSARIFIFTTPGWTQLGFAPHLPPPLWPGTVLYEQDPAAMRRNLHRYLRLAAQIVPRPQVAHPVAPVDAHLGEGHGHGAGRIFQVE